MQPRISGMTTIVAADSFQRGCGAHVAHALSRRMPERSVYEHHMLVFAMLKTFRSMRSHSASLAAPDKEISTYCRD
jgi:hypothetical protein